MKTRLLMSLAASYFALWYAWSSVAGATTHASPARNATPIERSDSPKKSAPAPAAGARGELLYENHCTGCHTGRAHVRDNRRAQSVSEVERWVRRWAGELNLGWSDEDVHDVTSYLARHYYKFDATPGR